MHPVGVEPTTFWFVVRHSIQLRYGCKYKCRGPGSNRYGHHWPQDFKSCASANSATPAFYKSSKYLLRSGRRDSNPRPPPWQGDVLPLNYFRMIDMPTRGFEPPTLCLQDRCSANWAKSALPLYNAIYSIICHSTFSAMSRDRLELSTLWLKVRCSTNWANGSR